ncbi:hypothetical protein [Rhodoferax mekongensis]|uniref:hypothetical protein n=1 Tax=Rhodoferax mekongensis TaxID=3068341 RepID=UPI0028BF4FCC|nr:hypothetical protein [Rhodoferax sp. TBRC 17199]MDT7514554.1 hypothetical protein [Rhodoferax sp. TBRC 17199]
MQLAINQTESMRGTEIQGQFEKQRTPLDKETRATLPTADAAFHLNRREQTLRGWACLENGPLRPIRVHGRLAWPVSELRRILGVA